MNSSRSDQTPSATVYHLNDDLEGLTLAAALKAVVPAGTWGQVKKWIQRRQVSVNGNLCLDDARRLSAKDVIHVHSQPLDRPVELVDIRIVHVDKHLLVVEKPAGINSVRHFEERKISTRRRQLQPTLEELLPQALAKALRLRWPPLPPPGMNRGTHRTNRARARKRPGQLQNAKKLPPELQVFPVHRLDRDTSGLMLFARTRPAEQRLVAMFRKHSVERRYAAVCKGNLQPQTIHSWLVRDRGDGLRGSIRSSVSTSTDADGIPANAQEAITHVVAAKPLADGQYSLLRCRLETGRTHQIRIHLSEVGHPICGDKIYHHRLDGSEIEDMSGAPRQALHSDQLKFDHPFTGDAHEFHMPLTKDLASWLRILMDGGD